MSWYFLNVEGDAAARIAEYKEAFEKAFAAAGGPRVMALFERRAEGGEVALFLTPDCGQHARELIEKWGAKPCERPSLIGLNLLVGHNEITYYMP